MKIALVVGARPNLVKAAALVHAAQHFPEINLHVIHTGQHTGAMSDQYMHELGLNNHTYQQTKLGLVQTIPAFRLGEMVASISSVLLSDRADYVCVVGDTDSTLAGAIAAAKLGIPVIHVEAGMRNFDKKMQEEINRVLVDHASTIHYCNHEIQRRNLDVEGIDTGTVVGNVMVDTLYRFLDSSRPHKIYYYAMFTMHRAENVDNIETLTKHSNAVAQVADDLNINIIWPVHPRYGTSGLDLLNRRIKIVPAMGYLEFISRLNYAEFVITDSGGVQEETTALNVPCYTIRPNTERPETVHYGTNHIVSDYKMSLTELIQTTKNDKLRPEIPMWDGHAAERIFKDLLAK